TTPVRNLSTTGHFVVDTLSLTIPFDFDLRRVEALALESARAVCSDWQADALRHMERLGAVELVALPNAEPKAIFEPVDAKESNLLIRFACPAQRRAAAKQELMKTFWSRLAAEGIIGAKRDQPATSPEGLEPAVGAPVVARPGAAVAMARRVTGRVSRRMVITARRRVMVVVPVEPEGTHHHGRGRRHHHRRGRDDAAVGRGVDGASARYRDRDKRQTDSQPTTDSHISRSLRPS